MNPGATTRPATSTSSVAGSSMSPTATTRPSRMPTSATRRAAPVPSTTVPPRRTRSRATSDLLGEELIDGTFDDGALEEPGVGAGEEPDGVGEGEVPEL